jgi:hypothetical protein
MAKLLSAKELEQIELGFRYVMNMTKNASNPAKKRAGRRGKNRIQQEEMQKENFKLEKFGFDPLETLISTIRERLEYVSQFKKFTKPEEISTAQQILQQVACLINLLHDYNNRIK